MTFWPRFVVFIKLYNIWYITTLHAGTQYMLIYEAPTVCLYSRICETFRGRWQLCSYIMWTYKNLHICDDMLHIVNYCTLNTTHTVLTLTCIWFHKIWNFSLTTFLVYSSDYICTCCVSCDPTGCRVAYSEGVIQCMWLTLCMYWYCCVCNINDTMTMQWRTSSVTYEQ